MSTAPPYYDNIGYSDLSDYFYIWMRENLREIYPSLFRRTVVLKNEELMRHHTATIMTSRRPGNSLRPEC